MTNSAWHWKQRAANGWSSTTPRTRKARTPRAKRVGGADDGRQGKAAATAPTWEGSPEGDAADAQSTYNRRTTGIQPNYNGPSGWWLAILALSSRWCQRQPPRATGEFSRVRTNVVASIPPWPAQRFE